MSEQERVFTRTEIAQMDKETYEQNREKIFEQMKQDVIR